jgi:quinone-modifying oxidoreductase subunit QmoB
MPSSSSRLTRNTTRAGRYPEARPQRRAYGAVILAAGWPGFRMKKRRIRPSRLSASFAGCGHQRRIRNHCQGRQNQPVLPTARKPSRWSSSRAPIKTRTMPTSYAGAVTSLVALKQAKYVREDYPMPTARPTVFYQHMRTPGLQEYFLQEHSAGPGHFSDQGRTWSVCPKTATAWSSKAGHAAG